MTTHNAEQERVRLVMEQLLQHPGWRLVEERIESVLESLRARNEELLVAMRELPTEDRFQALDEVLRNGHVTDTVREIMRYPVAAARG